MSSRVKSALAVVLLAAWFLGQTWRGLFVDFTEDDLMNMYLAWRIPPWKLALANLTPFTSLYRPFGSLYYHAMYTVAGLHALPFRIFAYAIMLLNIWLVYRLALLLTGSPWTSLLCALLFSYHKRLYALFVNGGTIYDLLSITFFLLAFAYYVSVRKQSNVAGWRLLAFCALYTLALNSKEMAASLPAILLVYELAWHRESLNLKWLYDRRAVWIAAAMTVVAFAFRGMRGSSFFGVPDYDLHFTLAQYFSTTQPLISQLFFLPEIALGSLAAVAIFAAALLLALLLRDRVLVLAAAIAILAPLPINFITYRGFFVMYFPLFGWALFFSTLLMKFVPEKFPAQAAAFLSVALALFVIEYQDRTWQFDYPRRDEERIHRMRKGLATLHDSSPKPHRVLFLHQALDPEGYVPMFIVRLLYRDPEITVDVAGSPRAPSPLQPESYDLVVDFCQGRYVKANSASCK